MKKIEDTIILYNGTISNEFSRLSRTGFKVKANELKAINKVTDCGDYFSIGDLDSLIGNLGTSAKKIFDYACACLSSINTYNSDDNIKSQVQFSLCEYAKVLGFNLNVEDKDTPEEQAKENKRVIDCKYKLKRQIKQDLSDIKGLSWTGTIKRGRNKGDYYDMSLISSHCLSKDTVTINFDISFAKYLVKAYVMQFPKCLFLHDSHKVNAYPIGRKIALHNSINHNGNNANVLSVKSLLSEAPDIPTRQDLKRWGQKNWRDKIKGSLESALNDNITVGLLQTWNYKDLDGIRYTPTDASILNWENWESMMIEFHFPAIEDKTEKDENRPSEEPS